MWYFDWQLMNRIGSWIAGLLVSTSLLLLVPAGSRAAMQCMMPAGSHAASAQASEQAGKTENSKGKVSHASDSEAQAIANGRTVFNTNCAHCHGEDAQAASSYYDLPELLSGKSDAFFFHTVTHGIEVRGMPSWRGVITHRQMADVLAFLRSVQKQEGITGN